IRPRAGQGLLSVYGSIQPHLNIKRVTVYIEQYSYLPPCCALLFVVFPFEVVAPLPVFLYLLFQLIPPLAYELDVAEQIGHREGIDVGMVDEPNLAPGE